jgi:alpha-amylase/alpha-mannosidase (GH57 family)
LHKASSTPRGYLTFTLHAHLPYVVNHGTWPHGLEWLHEAAAETYLPLLRMMKNLERDGLALKCNLNISPILLEQLAHPVFRAEFPKYVERKILAAREDEAFFAQAGDAHFAHTARFWQNFFQGALDDFNSFGGDIVKGFKHFHETGQIEIITCGATHGYMPLLGTDESVRAPWPRTKNISARIRAVYGRRSAATAPPATGSFRSRRPARSNHGSPSTASAWSRRSPRAASSTSSSIRTSSKSLSASRRRIS